MGIEHLSFGSAGQFVEALRLSNPRWDGAWPPRRGWAFRGQACADWPLLPGVWRTPLLGVPSEWIANAQGLASAVLSTMPDAAYVAGYRERMHEAWVAYLVEGFGVQTFVLLADEIGLSVPDYQFPLSPAHRTQQPRAFPGWEVRDPTEATALAQHHRIATRLLDWTRRPLVAAYFAASAALSRPPSDCKSGALAVWAIYTAGIAPNARVKVLSYPKHRNDFLKAQDGVFLFDSRSDEDFTVRGVRRCIGDILTDPRECCETRVCKLVLPHSEVPRLLDLLLAEEISRAHLQPTYDGVAQTALESPFHPRAG